MTTQHDMPAWHFSCSPTVHKGLPYVAITVARGMPAAMLPSHAVETFADDLISALAHAREMAAKSGEASK